MNYETAISTLATAKNPAKGKPIANNTRLYRREGGDIAAQLHKTDVVTFHDDDSITLNTGGWKTATTKERINSLAPVHLWQECRQWFVRWDGQTYLFADDMRLYPDGRVEGADPFNPEAAKAARKQDRAIKAYAKDFTDMLYDGKIEEPGGGDCWLCLMFKPDQPDPEHILSHVQERYYVPSLAVNAVKRNGSRADLHSVACLMKGQEPGVGHMDDFCRKQIQKSIYRYCLLMAGLPH